MATIKIAPRFETDSFEPYSLKDLKQVVDGIVQLNNSGYIGTMETAGVDATVQADVSYDSTFDRIRILLKPEPDLELSRGLRVNLKAELSDLCASVCDEKLAVTFNAVVKQKGIIENVFKYKILAPTKEQGME
ncbi:MAG: hypothetical protein V1837_03920 [Candidatus Woesearchaeota archaeon]